MLRVGLDTTVLVWSLGAVSLLLVTLSFYLYKLAQELRFLKYAVSEFQRQLSGEMGSLRFVITQDSQKRNRQSQINKSYPKDWEM